MVSGSLTNASHVAVTGASGLIGRALVQRLTSMGYQVRRVVRRTARPGEVSWNPENGRLDPKDLEGLDAVVNLAGENIGARWTERRKDRIRSSRLLGTRLLSDTVAGLKNPPAVLIAGSAIGIYGNREDEILTEESPPGEPSHDFLARLGQEWEGAADAARAAHVRVVHPRFGLVLSPRGGVLARMLLPFKLGLGGRLGSGSQWMSWVSIDDAVEALIYLLKTNSLSGPVNVTAPNPVRNRDFTRALGRVLSRPTVFSVPSPALRLVFGEMADATLLSSARVMPRRLLASGFHFKSPDLEDALRHVLREKL